jgi:membrane dipeptidase
MSIDPPLHTKESVMDSGHQLHENSIIIDATCPLASVANYWENSMKGGETAIAVSLNYPNYSMTDAMQSLGTWLTKLRENKDQMMLISSVDHIHPAKKYKKLGIIFYLQNSLPIETDLINVEIYYRLGVRMFQLAYNAKNFVVDGCADRTNCGLSELG